MTPQPAPRAGDLLAGRYRLVARTGAGVGCEHFRARDERLRRDVLVDVATQPAPTAPASEGVRALSGADDTGLHAILDGGAVAGRPFVVREVDADTTAVTALDTTAELHTGDATAVMPVPVPLPIPEPAGRAPRPPRPRREGPRPLVLGLIAAAVLVLVLTGVAFGGRGGEVLPTTTSTTPTTSPARVAQQRRVVPPPTTAPPTTAAPTTTSPPTTVPTTIVPDPIVPPGGQGKKAGPGRR